MNRAVSLFKQVTEPDLGFYRTTKTIILTYFNRWRLEFAKNDPCIKMFSESNSFSSFQSFFIGKQLGSTTVYLVQVETKPAGLILLVPKVILIKIIHSLRDLFI